ncbi:MAG TPA: PIG-L family deacetylase [Stellaceae bacterium]|nr:PIG-L family deacetylase [Stellaceae bacterium]
MMERVLLLVPHPDDEVVGCAAAIARACAEGAAFYALYLTTGVPPRAALWRWQRPNYARRIARRRAEAEAAARALGIAPLGFADWPARTLKAHLAETLATARDAAARCRADAIWVPAWEGGHQDHDVANFLAARLSPAVAVVEFAEYNFAGGTVRTQRFPFETGRETVLQLTAEEAARKRALLALYRSERGNLAHVGTAVESLRPLPPHDYTAPPHPGRLFRERFHWVPIPHPRIDFEPSAAVRAALRRAL